MTPHLDADSAHRYCDWRWRWRKGQRSQAMSILMHHGLLRALALTARLVRTAEVPAAASAVLDVAPVMDQVADMVRDMLVHEERGRCHA